MKLNSELQSKGYNSDNQINTPNKLKAMKAEEKKPEKERTHYTDEELQEFREIILDKLEKARHDLLLLTEAYSNSSGNDIMDTSPTFKVLEEGYQVLSKEENARLAGRQEKFIQSLENALVRIENKTYGICRETGKLIPKERLRAVPHATLSIEAKNLKK
jgi:RNA polymerase-binding transcription factor DksA